MKLACRINSRYQVEYFDTETGKLAMWEANTDALAYNPPINCMQYPIHGSLIKQGERIPYDTMKYGYKERDFTLVLV